MKIKTPPEKPIHLKNIEIKKIFINDGDSLEYFLNSFVGYDLSNVKAYDSYYNEEDKIFFVIYGEELEEHYQKRLKQYEIELEKYNQWLKENQENIQHEIIKKKERAEKARQTQIRNLEKQLARLKK